MSGRILVYMAFAVTIFSSILIFNACAAFVRGEKVVIVPHSKFKPDCEELLLDSLIADGVKICTMAQRHYHKTIALGGGGNSFETFTIPSRYDTTAHGTFWAKMSENEYHLFGASLPGACNNKNTLVVEFISTPDDITAYVTEPFD